MLGCSEPRGVAVLPILIDNSVHNLKSVELSLEPPEERMVQEKGGEEDMEDRDEGCSTLCTSIFRKMGDLGLRKSQP